MKAGHRFKKLICVLLSGALLATLLGGSVAAETYAEKVARLEKELAAQQSELKDIQDKKNSAEAQKKNLETQSANLKSQIETLVSSIAETESDISLKQNEIDIKQSEIDLKWENFKQQMAAMQEMNDSGAVAMLSNAKSLYELLTFTDALQRVSEKQTQLLDEMKTQREELQAAKDELQSKKDDLETQKAQMENKVTQLATNIQQTNSTITAAQAEAQAQQVEVDATQKALDLAKAQFDAYITSLGSSGGTFTSGYLLFPLASYTYISSYFGTSGHGGVDFAAPAGTPIFAAAEGTVQVAGYHDSAYSYGNYVVLDHGGGMRTLYAHMSSYCVSAGDYVQQGQTIGYVGSTGYSTGNHLHFEVRVNNVRVNPLGYLS